MRAMPDNDFPWDRIHPSATVDGSQPCQVLWGRRYISSNARIYDAELASAMGDELRRALVERSNDRRRRAFRRLDAVTTNTWHCILCIPITPIEVRNDRRTTGVGQGEWEMGRSHRSQCKV